MVPDGLEGEVHAELCKRSGDNVAYEGFGVPHNARVRSQRSKRELNVSAFGQGGATVATVIEILRNRMVTSALGITTISGLSGNVAIPRQTGAATAYALAESATLTKSTQVLDQVLLSPHRVGAWNDYTRQLLLQSSIDVENFIRDDLMKVLAIKWDALILNGQGAGIEPLGILQTPVV
jgi:HK97 family phage major capsid protein